MSPTRKPGVARPTKASAKRSKKVASSTKSIAKKPAAKKSPSKKKSPSVAGAKKATKRALSAAGAKKSVAKKTATKKSPVKKSGGKKSVAKKNNVAKRSSSTGSSAKKTAEKKATKRTVPAKRASADAVQTAARPEHREALESVLAFRDAFSNRQYRHAWTFFHPVMKKRIDPKSDPESDVLTPFALVELANLSIDAPFLLDPTWELVVASEQNEDDDHTLVLIRSTEGPMPIFDGSGYATEIIEIPFGIRRRGDRWLIESIGT